MLAYLALSSAPPQIPSSSPPLVLELELTSPPLPPFLSSPPSPLPDTQYKPDAVASDSSPEDAKGGTSSTAGIDRTTNMRLAEARLILNVKEDAPWEKIKAVRCFPLLPAFFLCESSIPTRSCLLRSSAAIRPPLPAKRTSSTPTRRSRRSSRPQTYQTRQEGCCSYRVDAFVLPAVQGVQGYGTVGG